MLFDPTIEAFWALLSARMLLSVLIFVLKREVWLVNWFVSKFVS